MSSRLRKAERPCPEEGGTVTHQVGAESARGPEVTTDCGQDKGQCGAQPGGPGQHASGPAMTQG